MSGPGAAVLGYLLNALWQAPVVACGAWAMAHLARRAGPAMEHRVWVAALIGEAFLPAAPTQLGVWLRTACASLLAGVKAARGGGQVRVSFGLSVLGGAGTSRVSALVLDGIVAIYVGAVVYFVGRLLWGLWRTSEMLFRARPAGDLGYGLDVRVSEEIAGPVTVGLWRGAVLLPEGFLGRISAEDLRAALAHEGAHVRRRDFLKNALYGLLTLPVAFHPAVWWTRRRVAESRELVCDALAAEVVEGRARYAGSLLRLASLFVEGTPERMLHAIGIFGICDANSFERRVMDLTGKRVEMTGARRVVVAVACGLLGLTTATTAVALRMGVPGQNGNVAKATGDAPVRVSGGVMAGNALTKVNPVYPVDAKEAGITGTVVMTAVIGKDGAVENLEVVSGPEKLRAASLEAVRQWIYRPYLLNGQPVEVRTTINVTYTLSQ